MVRLRALTFMKLFGQLSGVDDFNSMDDTQSNHLKGYGIAFGLLGRRFL